MIKELNKENIIMLGDLHFGKGRFSKELLSSQLKFFNEQLFPYMESNGIDTIIQVGDVFDNRTIIDIEFLDSILTEFFDVLKQKNFTFICLVGNHDIYHKSSREFTILNTINRLYDNVEIINQRREIKINDQYCYFIPWILPSETMTIDELKDKNYLFGHFEIRNFEMTKGHLDEHSLLSPEFFKKAKGLKAIFSGHYHIKSSKEKIHYLGTPYWLDWGDYNSTRGFYILDKNFKVTYKENEVSKKYIKLKYNDTFKHPFFVSGLDFKKDINVQFKDLIKYCSELKQHNLKLFINESSSSKHEELIFIMKEQGLHFDITNNVEISNIIGDDYIQDNEQHLPSSSKNLIKETVKQNYPELLKSLDDLFKELEESQ
jgi:DNA repair exonuclease SbcCD nuclease subunit